MAYQKLASLAHKLYQRTIDGKIGWELTTMNGVYQASFADYSIQISQVTSRGGGAEDIKVSIVDGEGTEIESFLDAELSEEWLFEMGVPKSSYEIMKDTYDTARRLALGSEKAVNDILSELDYF